MMQVVEQKVQFSKREKEIILLLSKAICRKTIARELNISLHTVDTHLRHIHLKTYTHSIPELIVWTLNYKNLIT